MSHLEDRVLLSTLILQLDAVPSRLWKLAFRIQCRHTIRAEKRKKNEARNAEEDLNVPALHLLDGNEG